MKAKVLVIMLLIVKGSFASTPLHLDLEMSSDEYRNLLTKNKFLPDTEPEIEEAITLGDRLSKWIAKVNNARTMDRAIRLTSPLTRRGIPIDKPNVYSPEIIKNETNSIMVDLPQEMKSILNSSDALPDTIPLDDEIFIIHARRVDRNYQSAARYKSVNKFRMHYIQAAKKDVRGYYYLLANKIGENELRDISNVPSSKLPLLKDALVLVCLNSTSNLAKCKNEVSRAFSENLVSALYTKHINGSRKIWDEFFRIPKSGRRRDITWEGGLATVPFNTPEIPKFIPYLKDNIEDEFRWENWKLKLNFGRFFFGPYLKFEPGVVPHVNRLGGNEIVMDSNQPIEEYESQWTIRHEFGHIIGLPDCYHEFYDEGAKAYVNYQLDTTDLMCSRAGNMNERIYLELENAYGR